MLEKIINVAAVLNGSHIDDKEKRESYWFQTISNNNCSEYFREVLSIS